MEGTAVLEDDDDTRPIVMRDAETGAIVLEFDPPDDLWLDMRAYCLAANITIEQLLRNALADFFQHQADR